MNYGLRTPCDNCPFRKVGGIRLYPERVREIARDNEGTFPCHKTTRHDEDGEHVQHDKEAHCAGYLIFREKIEHPNQMMRIAERLGMYDAKRLMTDNPATDEVFDSLPQMLRANKRDMR